MVEVVSIACAVTAGLRLPNVLTSRLQIDEDSFVLFCWRWRVQELSLFGSVVRDDFGCDSDVDVVV